jgi:uncharacterized membrane protein
VDASSAGGQALIVLGFLGLLAGALQATNTWDYPTYVGLGALIVGAALYRSVCSRKAGCRRSR